MRCAECGHTCSPRTQQQGQVDGAGGESEQGTSFIVWPVFPVHLFRSACVSLNSYDIYINVNSNKMCMIFLYI